MTEYFYVAAGLMALAIFVSYFVSSRMYEHRLKAMSVAIGFAALTQGLSAICMQELNLDLRNRVSGRTAQIHLTGPKALIAGAVLTVIGCALMMWGLPLLFSVFLDS